MTAPTDSHLFLQVGLASCIVLSLCAFALGVWNAYWHTRIKDQVEQVVDANTPSMAEAMPDIPDDDTGEIPVVVSPKGPTTEEREFGGHRFSFAVESPRAADPEAEVVQGVSRGGPVGRPSVPPSRPSPWPKVPSAPQRPEA